MATALEERLAGRRIEDVKASHINPELDSIARGDRQVRVDPGCDGVSADVSIQILVGAEDLDDLDLELEVGLALSRMLVDCLGTDAEHPVLDAGCARQLDLEAGCVGR